MIRVARIVGEGYDLEMDAETPKALVLSNGHREVQVFVDEDTMAQVIGLLADAVEEPNPTPNWPKELPTQDPPRAAAAPAPPAPKPPPKKPKVHIPVDIVTGKPLKEPEPEVDEGPGEEYDDAETGVASL